MDLGLDNQTAVITGGANGIGLATARLFLAEGGCVAIWDRSEPAVAALQEYDSERWTYFAADVTDPGTLEESRERTLERLGRIDHVVHAAAIGSGKFGFPFTNLDPEDWSRVLDVNIMGMVRVAHCLAPGLKKQSSGSMTFLASVAGQMGSQTDPPYSASKAANINFAQCLAKDLAASGVRVNVVNPGMVRTALNRAVWQAWADSRHLASVNDGGGPPSYCESYEDWAEQKIRQVVPLGRWQTAEDIANAIVFLASSRAANVTGQCLNVDGGFVMHS